MSCEGCKYVKRKLHASRWIWWCQRYQVPRQVRCIDYRGRE